MEQKRYKTSLTIAGSDSGGGAGIQADIKTFSSLGIYATSVITSITSQNTIGVSEIFPIPSNIVSSQLEAVLSDIKIDSIKLGMMYSADIIKVVAETLVKYSAKNIVVDPVLKSSTGDSLIQKNILESYKKMLFPILEIFTPNKDEAEIFTGIKIYNEDDIIHVGNKLIDMGCKAVLMKGGHFKGDMATDYFINDNQVHKFSTERIISNNDHGTGCTLSSAIASFLAIGYPLKTAIENAKIYISKALENGQDYKTGNGRGPLNHFYSPKILI